MNKEILFEIPALYRDDFRIQGYRFGSGQKSLCVVGAMRGNEYQQIYTCSCLLKRLKALETAGRLASDREVLVIPSLNPYSMNIGKRFWSADNTDINRMFPGYSLGETTQRIAAGVFDLVSKYDNGIQFASFYMPGCFSPHVRIMKTGYENIKKARMFGLPYIVLKLPKPYDTTTLNYNWQIWETDAFSLYTTTTAKIDADSAAEIVDGILRFMVKNDMILPDNDGKFPELEQEGQVSLVFQDRELKSVRPRVSGLFFGKVHVNEHVSRGQEMARILDPCDGSVLEVLRSPEDGVVFFLHDEPLLYANTAAIKILPGA